MSEWIRVEDGMPKPYAPCIVFMSLPDGVAGLFYDIAFYAAPVGMGTGAWGKCPTFRKLLGQVTHWQPIPAPPETP